MPIRRDRPNLKTIADAAGVSRMTVSLALRNSPRLAEETRLRIQNIAKKLGYRPNPMISTLMRQVVMRKKIPFTATLGFLTSFPTKDGWRERRLNRRFHEGVADRAKALGYGLEEFWLRAPRMTARRMSKILWSRNITGVIIAPLPRPRGRVRLDWEKFAAATIGFSVSHPLLHRAVNHQMRSMILTLRNLKRLGYRRIGLALSSQFDARADYKWVGGFLAYQYHTNSHDRVPIFVTDNYTEANFRKWFKANKPDAVVAGSSRELKWLRAMKVRVPQDVGFACLEQDDDFADDAGIHQNAYMVGVASVDLVVDQLERNERGLPKVPKTVMIEGEWVDGTTVQKNTQGRVSSSRRMVGTMAGAALSLAELFQRVAELTPELSVIA